MRSKIIDSGIDIGKELHQLLLEEDDRVVIENKRKQFGSISDDLAKEISDALISKNEKIAEFLKAEAVNCDTLAKDCKTVGDLIIKNTVIIILRSFDDHVTTSNVWFCYPYYTGRIDLKEFKSYIPLIEKTIFELYDRKIRIKIHCFELNRFAMGFSWY